MKNDNLESYAALLFGLAETIEAINLRKKNPDVNLDMVATELRGVATELLTEDLNEVQKSVSLVQRLINFIKNLL
jgi:hypothetical protein